MAKKHIRQINEFFMGNTKTRPTTAPPVTKPPVTRPFRPIPTTRPGEKEQTKPMAGFDDIFASTTTKPGTKPTTRPGTKPGTPTRPFRPIPTTRPGEKEQTKPMAKYADMIDLFFEELDAVKDTPEGKKMIKNLYAKYVK
jgi:hypothetical protein